MTKNLFLCASFSDVSESLPDFLAKAQINPIKTVSFIDVASHVEDYKDYVKKAKTAFHNLDLTIEVLDFTQSMDTLTNQLQKNDLIYISGGNTFYLLQLLKEKKLDTVIIDLINKGKPYIGESAGSVILAKDIDYLKDMDDDTKAKNLTNSSALNLVDFYPLPHFGNPPFRESADKIIKDWQVKIPLLAFSNHQAVLVLGKTIIVKSQS